MARAVLELALGTPNARFSTAPMLEVAYALTVVFTPGEGQLSIGLGGHEWVDSAISGAIGLVAVPPV